ncbi:MAG: SoxR reducing system RseC family protein [Kangiellaceae bacterium]|nr:SoxR reducing system RseC family protein [Kangiellaceae bacterium]MCW9018231.1 SoxR reducing system RseC family protein [Kangiellaceae bacterium]
MQATLTETGLVTKIEGNNAWVNTKAKLACSSCQVESTCGNGILEKYLAGKIFISLVPNQLNAEVGDEVILSVAKSSVTKASFVVYFMPLLLMTSFAFIAEKLFVSEPVTIISGMLGLSIGIVFISIYNRFVAKKEHFMPKMVSKMSPNSKTSDINVNDFKSIKIKNL